MKQLFLYIIILFFGLTVSSCKKKNSSTIIPPKPKPSLLAHKVNKFSYDLYNEVYLWSDDVPMLDPMEYDEEQEFFKKLAHPDDRWGLLTSEIKVIEEYFSGTRLTYGCSYFLILDEVSKNINGVVQFVFPGSPAINAGIKRGDIITKINGSAITIDNYLDLYYSSSINLGFGERKNSVITDIDKTVQLAAAKMYEDPILETKIFDTPEGKVGYLHYTDYVINSQKTLDKIFANFKIEGIKDVILDLRYNGGGYSLTSLFLSSILTTKQALTSRDIALKQVWNSKYNDYFTLQGDSRVERFAERFEYILSEDEPARIDHVTSNMDLSRLYVLVSSDTASASESTIASLELYLDVILIGSKTAGKFCAGALFGPSDIYEVVDPELENWGSYTMIYRYANKNDATNSIGGYIPNYEINEDPFNLYSIGSKNDPQIAKALELITGVKSASQYSFPAYLGYKLIKHDRNMLGGKLIEITKHQSHY